VFRRIARYVDSPGRYVHVITCRPGSLSVDGVKAQALANARRQIQREDTASPSGGSAGWDRVNVLIDRNVATAERRALGDQDFVLVGTADSGEIYSVTAVGVDLDQVELSHRDPSFLTPV
jgi:hypothetical protein